MQLPAKLMKCTWDGDHSFQTSAAGTGLVRHVCENCHLVSFDSEDYLSTRAMNIKKLESLIGRLQAA